MKKLLKSMQCGSGLSKFILKTAPQIVGTAMSFRNLPAVLLVLKKHHRCASRFGLAFSPSLEFFRGTTAQRRVQPLPIVILFDELSDVPP
jgi:hypothetical protein